MRITNDLMFELISELVGSDALPAVKYLRNRRNISEFKVAEKIEQDINITRNILYRLYERGLVTYTRKKDVIKGWYVSYWTFNPKRIKYLIHERNKLRLEKLDYRLKRELKSRNFFFICPRMCIRLDFDHAHELGFRCPECGSLLNQQDNQKTIDHLQNQIKEIKSIK